MFQSEGGADVVPDDNTRGSGVHAMMDKWTDEKRDAVMRDLQEVAERHGIMVIGVEGLIGVVMSAPMRAPEMALSFVGAVRVVQKTIEYCDTVTPGKVPNAMSRAVVEGMDLLGAAPGDDAVMHAAMRQVRGPLGGGNAS